MNRICSQQAANWKEGRRLRAWELFQEGWQQCRIASVLGATKGAISQWVKKATTNGPGALLHHKPPGARPKLSSEQRARLPELLQRGPQAWGFQGEVWTRPRIAEVVRREFGVSYHPTQIGRILKGYPLEPPEAYASCPAARRGGHKALGGGALAAAQKRLPGRSAL